MRVVILGVLLMAPAVRAAGTSTQPATAPSPHEFPASTPKEALRSLNLALRDGDAPAIRSLFYTRDERSHALVAAMAEYAAALANLHRAAIKTYGTEAADTVTGDLNAQSADGMAAIDKSITLVDGQSATVKFIGAVDAPVRLVKIDGRWKLPFSQLLEGADGAAEDRRLVELTLQARLARDMAEEVATGKFKDANKAAEVWRSRLLEPVTARSTTGPSTQPTTKPKA